MSPNSKEAFGVRIESEEGTHPERGGLRLAMGPPLPPPKPRPAVPIVNTSGQPSVAASVLIDTSAPAGTAAARGGVGTVIGSGATNETGPRVLSPPVNV